MSTKRIETLIDGVFAIALTLLVLNIDLPNIMGLLMIQCSGSML
ncbi:TMEM175 family protein [Methanobacterium sp. SMA-27]|nr:TMEM175 family protein [Methanobacterium sp. SMA-27]